MGSELPLPTIKALSIVQFSGNSMSGSRQVTGREDPASIGNFRRFDAPTIHFAFSKLYERCLSLKTGTETASFSKTSTICLKNSCRG